MRCAGLPWQSNLQHNRDLLTYMVETYVRQQCHFAFIWDLTRLRGDAIMGRCGFVPLRRLGNVLMRLWVFYLRLVSDVVEMH